MMQETSYFSSLKLHGEKTPGLYKRRNLVSTREDTWSLQEKTPGLYKRRHLVSTREDTGSLQEKIPGLYKPERFQFMWSLWSDGKFVSV